jgi:hypothetical protein
LGCTISSFKGPNCFDHYTFKYILGDFFSTTLYVWTVGVHTDVLPSHSAIALRPAASRPAIPAPQSPSLPAPQPAAPPRNPRPQSAGRCSPMEGHPRPQSAAGRCSPMEGYQVRWKVLTPAGLSGEWKVLTPARGCRTWMEDVDNGRSPYADGGRG